MIGRILRFLFLLAVCGLPAALPPAVAGISLTLDDLEQANLSARHVRLDVEGDGLPARVSVERVKLFGHDFGKADLLCPKAKLSGTAISCGEGRLSVGGGPPMALAFRLDWGARAWELDFRPTPNERWHLSIGRPGLNLELTGAQLARLAWLPALAPYHLKGTATGSLRRSEGSRAVKLDLSGISFGDNAGNLAGEKLAAHLEADALARGGGWKWRLLTDWKEGEAYFAPVYLPSGGVKLEASGSLSGGDLAIGEAVLKMTDVGTLTFSGRADMVQRRLLALQASGRELNLARAGELFLAPFLEQARLPKFKLGGRLNLALDWDGKEGGPLSRLDLGLKGGSVADPEGRLAFSGIEMGLPWHRDGTSQGRVSVAGGSLGKVPLGAFVLPLAMDGYRFELGKVEVPVFDGALALEEGRLALERGRWAWQIQGNIYPISMEKLTRALDIPVMAGYLAGIIPRISDKDGVVTLDGKLIFQVFDGYLMAQGVTLSDPFGRAPILRAETLEARHLDLAQLTQTFSFGDITGYLDGDVTGLELANWQPQRFDARFISSPGDYKKRISQRAMQNISSLGGARAGAMIEQSFLHFLQTFGYSRIGLSCRLQNGVCFMGGVKPSAQGYVLVEGGGVPALTVMGYNPAVDWNELLSRLKAIITRNSRPIIR